jgi:hypothetical protein
MTLFLLGKLQTACDFLAPAIVSPPALVEATFVDETVVHGVHSFGSQD